MNEQYELLEQLISEISNTANIGIPYYAYGDNEAACQMAIAINSISELANNAHNILSALQNNSADGWISVEDDLPEYNKRVLLYKSYHDVVEIGVKLKTDTHGEHYSCDYSHHVTHWQPLPKPPIKNNSADKK